MAYVVQGPPLGRIEGLSRKRRYPSGVELYRQGDEPVESFLLADGLIKLVRADSTGNETILGLRGKGSIVGLGDLVLKREYGLTATTVTRTVVHCCTAAELFENHSSPTALPQWITEVLALEVQDLSHRLSDLALLSCRQRVENLLCDLAHERPVKNTRVRRVRFPLKEYEVAQFLAMTPTHLCRVLAALEREGRIRRSKGWIVVLNALGTEDGRSQRSQPGRPGSRPVEIVRSVRRAERTNEP